MQSYDDAWASCHESIPTESIPTESIPTESIPTESIPTESIPTESIPTRALADVGAIKALTHPLRLGLIDLLGQYESITAAEAARMLDSTAAKCSFHLRQLAKYDFVEPVEVPSRRERPWRLKYLGITIADEVGETTAGFNALAEQMVNTIVERFRAYRRFVSQLSADWREVSGLHEGIGWLTISELRELDTSFDFFASLAAARTHGYEEIPEGARRVDIAKFVSPLDPPDRG
ncbi:winged helix-turn-helix domain-containing protein [Ferrimicrobium acidiphilum]|uniref:winged helix-turn-helix domain-containing protein n=1 Tax=Ferrimicrobium acidiphilum TaxID=121039 RepID=UPI0023F41D72|nr:helix-turn-helix domain-containing protein [Ferrimicrobium acidiphilum]MCL5053885.1 helix-turn-helix domain-containing protein [Gammaproteobacteria bacterium]